MKAIIFGHKQHGKGTVCSILREKYGITSASSSWTACELFLFDKLKDRFGYQTPEECYADRGNHRELWYNEIKAFNAGDLGRLGRIIFQNNDIYDGVRDDEEFYEMKAQKQFDIAIWVDGSMRKPLEDSNSMKLSDKDADRILDNNGTEEQLIFQVDQLYQDIFARRERDLGQIFVPDEGLVM